MFLGRNLILAAVGLLVLEVRNSSASYPYTIDDCGQLSYTAASGVVRYSERLRSYGNRGCSYRITVGQNNSVSIRVLSLNLQSTIGPCSRKWITLMCSMDQTREAITKTSSEICHEAKWTSSTSYLRVTDCPVLFVIVHVPHDDTSRYGSSLQTGSFQLGYEIIQWTPSSCPQWDIRPNTHSYGGKEYTQYTTVEDCLNFCMALAECLAVDINNSTAGGHIRCFVHNTSDNIANKNPIIGINHYVLVNRCTPPNNSSNTSVPIDVTDLPEIDCGETLFTNRSGVITLPRRTDVARVSINCTYTVEAAQQRTTPLQGIQRTISLGVSHFDLLTLTDSLDACDQDRLRIDCTDYDGQSRTVWGCAQHSQPKYLNCVKLEMILRSDNYDPRPVRNISYYRRPGDTDAEVNEDEDEIDVGEDRSTYFGCGNTVFTKPSDNITSPSFPLNYPHSIHCVYRIEVDRDKTISLNFRRFNLEYSSTCAYDGLKISCGLTEMNRTRKFCGEIQLTSALRFFNCSTVNLLFYADASATRGGFQIEYSTTPRGSANPSDDQVVCGTTDFRDSSGLITLPSNPSGFLKTINCTYSLYANDSSFFFLNMTSINLTKIASSIASCNVEQFLIACVSGEDSWRFDLCHNKIWSPNPRFSYCQQVQIKLYSKYFDFQEAFEIPFKVIPSDEICERTQFTASSGVISFPGLSQYYPPNVTCTYSIAGAIGSTISVSFLTFSMGDYENDLYLSRGCNDWIKMTCQSSNHVNPYAGRRFCGPLTWPAVVRFSNCSTLLLQFSTSPAVAVRPGNDQRNGFSLNYTVSASVAGGGENVIPEGNCDLQPSSTPDSGRITLPYNTSLPLVSVNCTFTAVINGSRKGHISFSYYEFVRNPDELPNCSQDHLTITCVSDNATGNINSVKVLRICWNAIPGSASLNYTECDSIRFSLLRAAYNPQQPRGIGYTITSKDCGVEEFTASTGNVKSPSYPNPYPHNINCLYTISAGRNKTVSLQSVVLRIEGQGRSSYHGYDSCAHDWLIIRCNGGTERISETGGVPTFRPPPDYEDYEDHDYYYYHRLRRRDFMPMRRSPYYTSSPSSYLDRRLCGSDEIRTTLVNCETITLEFRTDGSVAYQGFNIQYNATISSTTSTSTVRPVVDYSCQNQTFTGSTGVINSPNFTDRINCTYIIVAGESKAVRLEFLTLSSPSVSPYRHYYLECENTWLQVSCIAGSSVVPRNPLPQRICTVPEQNPILSGCERVSIQFYSSTRAEFRIRYTISESGVCGNTNFTNPTGNITSPGFPLPYLDNLNCTYYVEVGANNWLLMRIRSFNLEGDLSFRHYSGYDEPMTCAYDYLQVTCASGESGATSASLGRRLCGYRSPSKIRLSGCRRAALRFVTDGSDHREGFQIQYTTFQNGEDECGSKIFSNPTGLISSPGNPSAYEQDLNCTYVIEIGGQRSYASLQFLSFAVIKYERSYPWHVGCYSDWIQMRCLAGDVVAPSDVLGTKKCGHKLPIDTMLAGCQRLALQFFSDSTFADRGTGFQIQYRIFNPDDVCGLTSFNKSQGTIALPDSSNDYITTFNCTYSVYVGSYSSVTFKFSSSTTKKTPDEKEKENILPNDCIFIFCRGKKLNESDKITHNSSSQAPRTISNCSVVDLIFHRENKSSARYFNISYTLDFQNGATSGHTGSKPSAGMAIGVVAILILAALVVAAAVWWWRRRRLGAEPKADNRPFVADDEDEEADHSNSAITTTQDGFSFSVHQPNKASCNKYISLDNMT